MFQSIIFLMTLFVIFPLAIKYGDNVKQIASIGSYLKMFYELPSLVNNEDKIFNWEFENSKTSTINTDKDAESKLSKLFTTDFLILGILSIILYIVFTIMADFQIIKTISNIIILLTIIFIETIGLIFAFFTTIAIHKATNAKTIYMKHIESCNNIYMLDALKLGLYDEFSFEKYFNSTLTQEQKIKILQDFINKEL